MPSRWLSKRLFLSAATVVAALISLMAASSAAAQLIPNDSFDTNTALPGYTTYNSTLARVTTVNNPPDGLAVAKATWNGTSNWFSVDYDPLVSSTTAGQAYNASVKVMAQNANSVGDNITLSIRERTSAGATVAEGKMQTTLSSTTTFQTLTTSYTVHNTGDTLDVYVQEGASTLQAGSGFYADLISAGPPVTGTMTSGSTQAPVNVTSSSANLETGNATCPLYDTCNVGFRWRQVGAPAWTYTYTIPVDCNTAPCGFGQGSVISNLAAGTQYEYQGAVSDPTHGPFYVGPDGTSATTQTFTTTGGTADTTPPTVPTGLAGTPGNGTAALSWNASTDNVGVTGYDIYRNGAKIATSTSTSYTATGLTNGTAYSFTVDAYDAAGNTSAQSTAVNVTPQAPATSHTVPAAPSGPAAPAGGWRVEFGDAFGSCVTFTSMPCSAGYPRTDGAWAPQTKADGNSNTNEKGVVAFEPGNLDITPQGFVTTCTNTPNLGDAKTCGQMLMNGGPAGTNGSAPLAPNPFHMDLSSGTWAIQYQAQLPVNQGNMDPGIWENGPQGTPEIDNAEWFGMHKQPSGANTWCGMGWGFIAVPYGGSQSGSGDSEYWCQTGGPNFDPSANKHTYTMYFSGGKYTGYIDGAQVTSGSYNVNSSAFKLIAGVSMRKDTATGQIYALQSTGETLTVPYIAVYEAASANNTGSNGPMIEPGTTVTP